MNLETKFMLKVLRAFDEADDVHLPIINLAAMIDDSQNLTEEDKSSEDYPISNKLVMHLMHLQDLKAIQNLFGDCDWGYEPLGEDYGETMDDGFEQLIKDSFESKKFITPHCYESTTPRAV